MRLSPNFTLAEMERSPTALRLGIDNQAPDDAIKQLTLLCQEVLQPLRDHFGPVTVSSGYRCPALNQHIGGSVRSQHCLGQAADIVITGVTPLDVCRWFVDVQISFDQLIYEGTWTHISISDTPRAKVLTAHFSNGRVRYSRGLVA